jgi:predicted phosphoadenosine phosphosulfate sulfurtransferase
MTGRPQVYRTTDKCPASLLVSRPYRIGYNALYDGYYRRLVLLVQLRLNSYLPPFRASVRVWLYSVVKVHVPSQIIQQKEGLLNFKMNLHFHDDFGITVS